MANLPVESWELLTETYRKIPQEDYFLTKTFGKKVVRSPLPEVKIRVLGAPMTVATLGKAGDPARAVRTMGSYTEYIFETPEIYEYDEVTTEMAKAGQWDPRVLTGELKNADDIAKSLSFIYGEKLAELKNRVARRKELMFAQILTEGKISYSSTERSIEIDFNVDSPVAYTLASDTKVLTDLMDYVETFANEYGKYPDIVLVTPNVAKALLENDQVMDYLDKTRYGWGNIDFEKRSANVRYFGNFPHFGIPDMYIYTGKYVDESGSTKYYIPFDSGTGKIILADTGAFRLAYGGIINFKLDPTGRPKITDVIVRSEISDDGNSKRIYVQTRPLPYIVHNKAVKVLSVTLA